jgi:23S rRNA maturation-related 3'-5' exoribonuclease YhaM
MNELNPDDFEAISAAMKEVKNDKEFISSLKINILKHHELLERLNPGAEPDHDREWRVRKLSEIIKRIKDEDAEILGRLGNLDQAIPMNLDDI